MRLTRLSKLNDLGYTMVELMVVLPIISLISIGLFAYMFNTYGDMLIGTAESNLRLEAQSMLLSLEDELLFTLEYGSTMSSDLNDPWDPVAGWSNTTTPIETLIIYETALDSDRRDPNRDFIYKRNGNFGSCTSDYAINNLIYFTEESGEPGYYTLFKRTITPDYSTCGINYKKRTCPAANVGGSCLSSDAVITEKLKDFQVDYFDEENVPTTIPSLAEKIEVVLTLGEKIYGKDIEAQSKFIIKKIN